MSVAITVKNIPQDLYGRLKSRAGRNRRSVNSEIIAIIEDALTVRRIDPEAFLAKARSLRGRTGDFTIDDEFIEAAKREGRP